MPSWAQAKVWGSCCELFSPFCFQLTERGSRGLWQNTTWPGLVLHQKFRSRLNFKLFYVQISAYLTLSSLLYYVLRDSSEHHHSLKTDLFCRFWTTVLFPISWVTRWCRSSSEWARKMLPVQSCDHLLLKSQSDFVCVFWGASKERSLNCNPAKQSLPILLDV